MIRRRSTVVIALVFGVSILVGWYISTRIVKIRFTVDGVPVLRGTFEIIGGEKGVKPRVFEIQSEEWIRLPSSYVGKYALCVVTDGEEHRSFYESGFSGGETTVNFTANGIESEHFYKFLFYERQTREGSLNTE